MKRYVTVMFLLGMAIGTTGFRAYAVEPAGALTRDEAKALISAAKTPEDHMKLSGYYRAEALKLQAEVKDHEAMAAAYDKNPLAHPIPKGPSLGQHCRNLVKYYGDAAKAHNELADMHEAMARNAK